MGGARSNNWRPACLRRGAPTRPLTVPPSLARLPSASPLHDDEERVVVRAWGCSRPLVWCFGEVGLGEPYSAEGAAKNRRVELYLSSGEFEVPKRRRRSEVPR